MRRSVTARAEKQSTSRATAPGGLTSILAVKKGLDLHNDTRSKGSVPSIDAFFRFFSFLMQPISDWRTRSRGKGLGRSCSSETLKAEPNGSYDASGNRSLAQSTNGTNTLSVSYSVNEINHQEGVGMSKNTIYGIHTTSPGAPVRYYLSAQNEGAFAPRLSVNHFLAKSTADTRFAKRDHILLPTTDQGITFSIDDSGNWVELGEGTINQFDRFAGVVGPNDPNAAFPSSYVVKPK